MFLFFISFFLHLFVAIFMDCWVRDANFSSAIGQQTQERRKSGIAQEACRAKGRYEFVSELDEIGEGRGYKEGEIEKGVGGEEGGRRCREER